MVEMPHQGKEIQQQCQSESIKFNHIQQ